MYLISIFWNKYISVVDLNVLVFRCKIVFLILYRKKTFIHMMVAYHFNFSSWKAEAGRCLSSRAAWATV